MTYYIESLSHQGNFRKNNEDAISYGINASSGACWMLVADGMGGHNAGEVASNMLIEHVEQQWDLLHKQTDKGLLQKTDWPYWITTQLNQANSHILTAATENISQQGMGTTGVLMVICNHCCYIGWVGDSRAYLQSDEKLKQVTTDHTMIQVLLKKGAITELEAKNANTKNLLSQAIGVAENIEVDTVSFDVKKDDVIMLSTDGLHDFMSEPDIKHYLSTFSEQNAICELMVEQSLTLLSKDNLTLGVIKLTS